MNGKQWRVHRHGIPLGSRGCISFSLICGSLISKMTKCAHLSNGNLNNAHSQHGTYQIAKVDFAQAEGDAPTAHHLESV